jgi:hypothetical protein
MKRPGAIIFILFPALILGTVALSFLFPKTVHNTAELAKYTDCEPENIRQWLDHEYTYDVKFNDIFGNDGDEPTGDVCIARKTGNCRCYAAISQDALNECPGYHAHTACMLDVDKVTGHCLTYFTGPKGVRGFINSGAQAETYPAGTDWAYIEGQVSGGPWVTP